ncbi:hypothetical protein J6590_074557 [Homalodisca vitripennis]|nr:hypothetical protein J6590_074557 [Homalodisca vitripennis]
MGAGWVTVRREALGSAEPIRLSGHGLEIACHRRHIVVASELQGLRGHSFHGKLVLQAIIILLRNGRGYRKNGKRLLGGGERGEALWGKYPHITTTRARKNCRPCAALPGPELCEETQGQDASV